MDRRHKPEVKERILAFIKTHTLQKGYSPTVREVMAHMDFKSTSTAHYHLGQMVALGLITNGGGRRRAFAPAPGKHCPLCGH